MSKTELIILPPKTWSFLFMSYLHEKDRNQCSESCKKKKKSENLATLFPIILSLHFIHLVTKDSNPVCFTNGHCFSHLIIALIS